MCKSKDCQHGKESPIKDWKHRCQFGPDGRKLPSGMVIKGWNDFKFTHPSLAKECLDDATDFTGGSQKAKRWKCSACGHEWSTTAWSRAVGGGCRPCSYRDRAKKLSTVPYRKSAAFLLPHLVKEHQGPGNLRSLAPNSCYFQNWKCRLCGHKWSATLNDRARGYGCWPCGIKARAKKFSTAPYGKSVAFIFPHLVKEHQGPDDLRALLPGSQFIQNWKCSACGHKWSTTVCERTGGSGCRPCAFKRLAVNRSTVPYKKSAAFLYPHLVCEHQGPGDLGSISPGSKLIQHWKCSTCGLEWSASVGERCKRGSGCRPCANKATGLKLSTVPYKKSAAFFCPELVEEHLGPRDLGSISRGSNFMQDWKCKVCGHEWRMTVVARIHGRGCPHCAKGGHDQTQPSFIYLIYRPGQIKYGIMNTWTDRLKNHAKKGWELLDKIETTGRNARSLETKIKQTLRAKEIPTGSRAFQKKFPGYSETFQEVDLYVRSIRGLCRKLGVNLEAFLAS